LPLYEFTCDECGNDLELVLPVSELDNVRSCECGSKLRRIYSPFTYVGFFEIDTSKMSDKERSFHLRNKKWLESREKDIRDGKLGVNTPKECPKEFRAEFSRKFH